MNNQKLPTAEELLLQEFTKVYPKHGAEMVHGVKSASLAAMTIFAKLHCKRQAEVIAEKATWKCDSSDSYFGDNRDYDFCDRDNDGDKTQIHTISVDKDSILNAYNLEEEIK